MRVAQLMMDLADPYRWTSIKRISSSIIAPASPPPYPLSARGFRNLTHLLARGLSPRYGRTLSSPPPPSSLPRGTVFAPAPLSFIFRWFLRGAGWPPFSVDYSIWCGCPAPWACRGASWGAVPRWEEGYFEGGLQVLGIDGLFLGLLALGVGAVWHSPHEL